MSAITYYTLVAFFTALLMLAVMPLHTGWHTAAFLISAIALPTIGMMRGMRMLGE